MKKHILTFEERSKLGAEQLAKQNPVTLNEMRAQVLWLKRNSKTKGSPDDRIAAEQKRLSIFHLISIYALEDYIEAHPDMLSGEEKKELLETVENLFDNEAIYVEKFPDNYFSKTDRHGW